MHAAKAVVIVAALVVMAACTGDGGATLSAGEWTPSSREADTAGFGGVLSVDGDGCLHVNGPTGEKVDVIWPAGYTGKTDNDNTMTVVDPGGQIVAESGKPFLAEGLIVTTAMFDSLDITDDRQCSATTADVTFVVQSELPPLAEWYTADSHVVTLYHCGVDLTEFEGRQWAVPQSSDPFFDDSSESKSFVGRGTMVKVSSDKAVYTDESGMSLTFVPIEQAGPRPCA